MIITVLGGPDVGKSSLISQILIETGCIDNREIDKIQKEAKIIKKPNQWLPNLIDTNYEEKERGITLEPNSETFLYKGKNYTIINNPGHKTLTNRLFSYSSKADIAILVISANQKEFTKCLDQGFEHSLICKILGVKTVVVCINKAEFIDSNDKYTTIVNTIKNRLKS